MSAATPVMVTKIVKDITDDYIFDDATVSVLPHKRSAVITLEAVHAMCT